MDKGDEVDKNEERQLGTSRKEKKSGVYVTRGGRSSRG